MTAIIIANRGVVFCKVCRDEVADHWCVRCGQALCTSHARKCFYCHSMKRAKYFCGDCAQIHVGYRQERHPPRMHACLRDFRSQSEGYQSAAIREIRAEHYKKQGWI